MAAVRQLPDLRVVGENVRIGPTVLLCLFICLFILWGNIFVGELLGSEIVSNPGKYGRYYHMRFELKAHLIDFDHSDRALRSGGQFEIRIKREQFPVAAPHCKGPLILRMPWTPSTIGGAQEKIAKKQALLKRILALQGDAASSLWIVIELNPYIKVVKQKPLTLQLMQCNIFFRDYNGEYVDDTNPRAGKSP